MPRTPDRFPGIREEEALQFDEGAVAPTVAGEVRYVNGCLAVMDSRGAYDPRRGALELPMVNSITGEIYTSCADGEIYLME